MKVLKIKIGLAVRNTEKKRINGEKQPKKMYGVACGIITPYTFVRGVDSRLTPKPILHTLV